MYHRSLLRPITDAAGALRRFLLLIVLPAHLAMTSISAAQEPASGEVDRQREETELAASDQPVEVQAPAEDEEIAERLQDILEATGRFIDARVDVRDGVVFLDGRTSDERDHEWASDLARKTRGVVAVINNIAVDEDPVWTIEPAAREVRELWQQVIAATPLVIIAVIVLLLTLVVARLTAHFARPALQRRLDSDLMRGVLEKVLLTLIVLVGIYLFLRIAGLTGLAVTIAGGTGLLGLVIGFAFQNIAENFLASILISTRRPFQIGDTIEVNGHTGVVQKVTTRGTVLMDFDGNHIQIANATVYKSTICNFNANPNLRLNFTIGIGYDASIARAQAVAIETLREHSAVLARPEPMVLVEELRAATINLRVYFWINGQEHSMLKARSSLMRLIVRAYEREGISLPDEAREVVFPQGVPVQMLPETSVPSTTPGLETRETRAETEEATDAEGDLSSEVSDIQQQAREARVPEEGANIMGVDTRP